MYVKHMDMRANNIAEDTNIEQGLGLQLNQHWQMSSYESKIAPRGRWSETGRTGYGPLTLPEALG